MYIYTDTGSIALYLPIFIVFRYSCYTAFGTIIQLIDLKLLKYIERFSEWHFQMIKFAEIGQFRAKLDYIIKKFCGLPQRCQTNQLFCLLSTQIHTGITYV